MNSNKYQLLSRLLMLSALVLLLAACGREVRQPPLKPPPTTRVLVLGISSDPIQMSAFEGIFANALRTESKAVCLVGTGLPDLREGLTLPTLQNAMDKAHAHVVVINRVVPTGDRSKMTTNLQQYLALAQEERSAWRDLRDGLLESRVFQVDTGEEIWRGYSSRINPKGQLQELARASENLAEDLADSDRLPQPGGGA